MSNFWHALWGIRLRDDGASSWLCPNCGDTVVAPKPPVCTTRCETCNAMWLVKQKPPSWDPIRFDPNARP